LGKAEIANVTPAGDPALREAKAGVYSKKNWIPAFAGMTNAVSATGTT